MVLPSGFVSYDDYFDEALSFFGKYQYLYNYANIDVLANGALQKIPRRWLEAFDESSKSDSSVISTSHELFNDYCKLAPQTPHFEEKKSIIEHEYVKDELPKGLSLKKYHEVINFSKIIARICSEDGVSAVVDLGSGLGYLSELLHEAFDFQVLGIESDNKRVATAIERLKLGKSVMEEVSYVQHFVTSESADEIMRHVRKTFPIEKDFYLIGLHACADLTVDAIKLFLKMDRCKGLAIMPCCYHKMRMEASEVGDKFENFPLSSSLKRACEKYENVDFLKRPFLRMCCQRAKWQDDEQSSDFRTFHLLSRAVLQLYASKENLKLTKKRRRPVSKEISKNCEFKSFLCDAITYGYKFEKIETPEVPRLSNDVRSEENAKFNKEDSSEDSPQNASTMETEVAETKETLSTSENREKPYEVIFDEVSKLWNNLSPEDFSAATLLIELQDALQPLGENLVLLDKLAYLLEQQDDQNLNFEFVKVTDEELSPRCYALLANKSEV